MPANEKLAPQRACPVDDRFYSCAHGFSHPLIRENVNDFIQDSYRGSASFGDDADTSIRPGSHSGAGPSRVLPSNADVLNGGAPTPEASLASAPPEAREAYATMESATPLLSEPSVIAPKTPSPAPSLVMTVAGIDAGEVRRSNRRKAIMARTGRDHRPGKYDPWGVARPAELAKIPKETP
jgi:hypothetical protein